MMECENMVWNVITKIGGTYDILQCSKCKTIVTALYIDDELICDCGKIKRKDA